MTAGLLSGGAAGLLLLAPSLADAASPLADAFGQTTPPTTEPTAGAAADDAATDPATDPDAAGDEDVAGDDIVIADRGERLRELLQPLVDDGTITAEQLDAVVESVQSALPHVSVHGMPPIFEGGGPVFPGHPGRPDLPFPNLPFPDVMGGHGGPGGLEIHAGGPGISVTIGDDTGVLGGGLFGSGVLDLVANTIGITAPDLIDQLADGSTVAEIATTAGTDPQAVIDALVADVQERLDAGVQSGRITQAEADERIENVIERITSFVNGEQPSTDEQSADDGTQQTAGSEAAESTATTETTSA